MRCVVVPACLAVCLALVSGSPQHPQIYTKLWPSLSSLTHSVPVIIPYAAPQLPTLYYHGKLWRNDGRCGDKVNPDGEHHVFRVSPGGPVAQCDPNSADPCCSAYGWCGHGRDTNGYSFCTCSSCEDYSPYYPVKKWRDDHRCGAKENPDGIYQKFRAPNGDVAECDPNSSKPCCSAWGYCGIGTDKDGAAYCTCSSCVDYRR